MSGFPSPAKDYVETRLSVASICNIDANCLVIETSRGYAVVDKSMRPKTGEYALINYSCRNHFALIAGKSLITEDGEAIEGEALDDVTVVGVVTWLVNRTRDDEAPVM
ncbi:hypothetical protein EGT71_15015 [Atlantibacter subterranea]|uniref:DNA polymerase V n=1 Tax=Atlantibacter subterraneus TaxID=255519 RepID=A0A3R9G758_9ENTR|nr:hypothetical protein [Atlantibacter subterranea]RSB61550.1 hypothetical protein EGK67_13445 [Atlantibacter subterranea]RSE04667.1 hypothetical protein EGT84_13145 [Atlantibacter subterranea]RSE24484.1 hypothetical protein EGT71_15015 [Atlantibacter subterranea]